jgi:hypothetical protein
MPFHNNHIGLYYLCFKKYSFIHKFFIFTFGIDILSQVFFRYIRLSLFCDASLAYSGIKTIISICSFLY